MSSTSVWLARDPRPMLAASYLTVAIMYGIGIATMASPLHQGTALALGIAFSAVYAMGFRALREGHSLTPYFAVQTALITATLLLPVRISDAFNFAFYLMTFQGWMVFAPPTIIRWTVLFFTISATRALAERGPEGLISIAFFAGSYILTSVLGYTARRSELARRENERLLDELREAQRQLQELAIAEERNRLARDLHNSVKQQVFAVMMQLGAARVLLGAEQHPAR
jgi:signal transduction histidine kinase